MDYTDFHSKIKGIPHEEIELEECLDEELEDEGWENERKRFLKMAEKKEKNLMKGF